MMSDQMISMMVSSLTPSMGISLARRYGVEFTMEEANVIVPFLKAHRNELTKENKGRLLSAGRSLVSPDTYRKIETLVNKLI